MGYSPLILSSHTSSLCISFNCVNSSFLYYLITSTCTVVNDSFIEQQSTWNHEYELWLHLIKEWHDCRRTTHRQYSHWLTILAYNSIKILLFYFIYKLCHRAGFDQYRRRSLNQIYRKDTDDLLAVMKVIWQIQKVVQATGENMATVIKYVGLSAT